MVELCMTFNLLLNMFNSIESLLISIENILYKFEVITNDQRLREALQNLNDYIIRINYKLNNNGNNIPIKINNNRNQDVIYTNLMILRDNISKLIISLEEENNPNRNSHKLEYLNDMFILIKEFDFNDNELIGEGEFTY